MEVNIILTNSLTPSVKCIDGDLNETFPSFIEAELTALVDYMVATYFSNSTFIIDKDPTSIETMIIEHPNVPVNTANLELNIKSTGKYKPATNYYNYIQTLIV